MPADYHGQIKPASWSLGLDILSRENPLDRQSKQLVLKSYRPLGKSIYPLSDLSLGLTSGDGSFPWWHQPFSHTPFPQPTRGMCVGNRDPTKEHLSLYDFISAASTEAAESSKRRSSSFSKINFKTLSAVLFYCSYFFQRNVTESAWRGDWIKEKLKDAKRERQQVVKAFFMSC